MFEPACKVGARLGYLGGGLPPTSPREPPQMTDVIMLSKQAWLTVKQ